MNVRAYVAVIGPGIADPGVEAAAHRVGLELAKARAIVVCGGLGGAMAAACRGAKETGGITVGILPGTDRADANQYVDIAIPTGMGEARNALVVRAADAVIAVGGGFGTLSEIALALKIGKRVVGVRTWNLGELGAEGILPAETPEEAVRLALAP